VEQGRAPSVLPHHAKLARQATGEPHRRRRTDCGNHDQTGLKVECVLDERTYEKGIKVSDAEMDALDIRGDTFHPEWNYSVHPRPAK
jgi:hypothetical protein